LKVGTTCWIIGSGVIAATSWKSFIGQLRDFEQNHSQLPLNKRITKLRQWAHDSNLPFDSIIGTPGGTEYLDTRDFNKDKWQLLKDAQIVRMPDGKRVDVYHLIVGLDVLHQRVEDQTYLKISVGPNYSAALFAGDLGAAVSDAYVGKDADWESKQSIPPPGDKKRLDWKDKIVDRYYSTRAPESDLLGDIDAWGIDESRSNEHLDSIEKLLTAYYAPSAKPSSGGKAAPKTRRRSGVEAFYRGYGLNTAAPLDTQTPALKVMSGHVYKFAVIWYARTKGLSLLKEMGTFGSSLIEMGTSYLRPIFERFTKWLGKQAKENKADVKAKETQ
jgi:hypothetical protein